MSNILFIGNKNYSSWSLRPWLCLRWADIAFEEKLIRLDQPGYGKGQVAEVLAVSPTGRLPALHADGQVIWDSLAIAEWAAERAPDRGLWPAQGQLRAEARAVSCEMHSGFAAIRNDLPMNIHRRCPAQNWSAPTRAELARISQMWTELRSKYASRGPFLFGERCIADAFYTPVAARLRSYSVEVPSVVADYRDTLLSDPDFRQWEADSIPQSWDTQGYSIIDGVYTSRAQAET